MRIKFLKNCTKSFLKKEIKPLYNTYDSKALFTFRHPIKSQIVQNLRIVPLKPPSHALNASSMIPNNSNKKGLYIYFIIHNNPRMILKIRKLTIKYSNWFFIYPQDVKILYFGPFGLIWAFPIPFCSINFRLFWAL